jgi:ribokinase
VLVSGYALLQPDSEAAGLAALERARCDWLAVDGAAAGLLARYGPGRFFSATERAGILLVNEAEARVLVEGDPAVAAEELGKRYAIACVKLGPAGVVASVRGDLVHVPSSEVEARNTVGCGDAFAAGLLGALARGDEPDRALVEACRLGALAAESTAWPPVAQRIS